MQLPVFVLEPDDDVPFPGETKYLELNLNRFAQFFPTEVQHGGKFIKQIILLLPKNNKKDDTSLEEQCHNIGILCEVTEIDSADAFAFITIYAQARVEILRIFQLNENLNNTTTFEETYCSYIEIDEYLLQDEELLASDIQTMKDLVLEKPYSFNKNLVNALNKVEEPHQLLHVFLGNLIQKYSERVQMILTLSNHIRWDVCVEAITNLQVKDKKKKNPPPPPKKKNLSIEEQIKELPIDIESRASILKEAERLKHLPKGQAEHANIMDYLDWALTLPWGTYTAHAPDLKNFKHVLDETHFGLQEPKEHLLEHLVIDSIRNTTSGSVICFIGPPGTGKTTIAAEIAKATGRSLQRIALGGLTDESELRGHRRTYVGSRPGRFIVGVRAAKAMDPLFVLDEVDKIARYRGDPSSALLEILDPEQNHNFIDRYLEIPVNLSKAMFICTANTETDIHPALLDRMEIIRFKPYSESERIEIATKYILPKLFNFYKLEKEDIIFDPTIIDLLCKQEPQVRQLEKHIARLMRMAAVQIHVHDAGRQIIDIDFAAPVLSKPTNTKVIGIR